MVEIYLNALAHVYDPHSDYLGHEELQSLSIALNLSLFGIGASLTTEDGTCVIRELIPGGPAARSGLLKAGRPHHRRGARQGGAGRRHRRCR